MRVTRLRRTASPVVPGLVKIVLVRMIRSLNPLGAMMSMLFLDGAHNFSDWDVFVHVGATARTPR